MKPGDLVRYKYFPHTELHNSGRVGLVLGPPRPAAKGSNLVIVDILWSPKHWHDIQWDYIDEIEVIKFGEKNEFEER